MIAVSRFMTYLYPAIVEKLGDDGSNRADF